MHVLLCSSSETLRRRWTDALEELADLYHATTLRDLDLMLHRTSFDVLLLHRSMVDLVTAARTRARSPGARLFILSDRPDDAEGLQFLRCGAVGYGNAFITPARLRQAVRLLAEGSVWVGQRLMERLIRESAAGDRPGGADGTSAAPLRHLSNREYQVALLLAEGLSNREIGRRLGITERTVKAHLGSIYSKTGTRGRLNLALLINGRVGEVA